MEKFLKAVFRFLWKNREYIYPLVEPLLRKIIEKLRKCKEKGNSAKNNK